jgi:hypothetical protein
VPSNTPRRPSPIGAPRRPTPQSGEVRLPAVDAVACAVHTLCLLPVLACIVPLALRVSASSSAFGLSGAGNPSDRPYQPLPEWGAAYPSNRYAIGIWK